MEQSSPICPSCKNLIPWKCVKWNDKHEYSYVYYCKFCKDWLPDSKHETSKDDGNVSGQTEKKKLRSKKK